MSDDKLSREKIKKSIIDLLSANIGFDINFFDTLSIQQLEDLRFRIFDQREFGKELCDGKEYIFKDVNKAVEKFLAIREERQLGFDFEIE